MNNELIYGKSDIQNIVSLEVRDEITELFIQQTDNSIKSELVPNHYWILSHNKISEKWHKLNGNLHFQYGRQFQNYEEFQKVKKFLKEDDIFTIHDPKENFMSLKGITYFKGLIPSQISILSFDLETTSLNPNIPEAKLLLISNTFRKNDILTKKLFSYDEFQDEGEMISSWCKWVREMDPSIICGHNINGFDLNYLTVIGRKYNVKLKLGRDDSKMRTNTYESRFRKDGSQELHYFKSYIYGREIIDTMFLAYKYDIARNYPSYGLKPIIEYEKLKKVNRTFYDASQIRFNYTNPIEWIKIKEYAKDDSDDSLALFDLMAPAQFYLTQMVPKSFQSITESASGSQINSMLIRSYLQNAHSIPKATQAFKFEGAISLGISGIHKNVLSFDVASLYPSIMLQYNVNDISKDPDNNFIKILEILTNERLKNKKLAKETKKQYYKDMEQSQKIYVNSMYGFKGAVGLNFNDPLGANIVTQKGREILKSAIEWATSKKFDDWSKENNLE